MHAGAPSCAYLKHGWRCAGVRPLLLDMQYRMHPLIADLPSQLFYAGRLMSGVDAAERPLPTGAPSHQMYSRVACRALSRATSLSGRSSRAHAWSGTACRQKIFFHILCNPSHVILRRRGENHPKKPTL